MNAENNSPFLAISPADWLLLASRYFDFIADGVGKTNRTPSFICDAIERQAEGFIVDSGKPLPQSDSITDYVVTSMLAVRELFSVEACNDVARILDFKDAEIQSGDVPQRLLMNAYALRIIGLCQVWTQIAEHGEEILSFQPTVFGEPLLRLLALAGKVNEPSLKRYVDNRKDTSEPRIVLPH